MTQLTIFEQSEGERRRDEGIAQAANMSSRRELLAKAQYIACCNADYHGSVTADDVFAEMEENGLRPDLLGNAWGSIFRGKEWECIGWRKSTRVSNHARAIRIWRLK